ncbi:hypothetical protein AB0F11_24140 [Streptomyces sp. NPDC032472]|uniref:hypothetical protein n=1 Tax=Streptomyces sp. NPDC032472 TaxID=3155018 RepID=UPI0033E34764
MSSQPQVIVHAPDGRGLREVSLAGQVVGWAWSLRDLRRVLRRAGVGPEVDLGNPGLVRWRADPGLWPDKAWVRRTGGCFMAVGLLVSAAVLSRVGLWDVMGALTFGGRVMGAVFLTGALLEVAAAAAVVDFWGKRRMRYSGPAVVLGVVVAAVTSLMLLVLQWEGGYRRGWLWLWAALATWCCWAGWALTRQKAWRGVPHPRRFALGVALSGLVGAASLAYSSMYSPYVAPPKVPFGATFGKPSPNAAHTSLYVPVRLTFRNDGPASIHVVGTLWSATLWPSAYTATGTDFGAWESELGNGWDSYRHERSTGASRVLAAGRISGPGDRLDPGDDFSRDVVVEVPAKGPADGRVEIYAIISFIRADRGKLANSYRDSAEYSWNTESDAHEHRLDPPGWLAEPGDEFFRYRARIYRSSAIMRITQAPDWAAMWWVIPKENGATPYMEVHIARDADSQERLSDAQQEPYGMKTLSTSVDQPVALLKKAAGPR